MFQRNKFIIRAAPPPCSFIIQSWHVPFLWGEDTPAPDTAVVTLGVTNTYERPDQRIEAKSEIITLAAATHSIPDIVTFRQYVDANKKDYLNNTAKVVESSRMPHVIVVG